MSSPTNPDQVSRATIESMQMDIEQLRRRLEAVELHPALTGHPVARPEVLAPVVTVPRLVATPTGNTFTWITDVEPDLENLTSTGRMCLAIELTPVRMAAPVSGPAAPVPPVEPIVEPHIEPTVVVPAENVITTTAEVYPDPEEPFLPAPKRLRKIKTTSQMKEAFDPLAMEPEDPEAIEAMEKSSSESIEVVHDSREAPKRKCSVVLKKVKTSKRRAHPVSIEESEESIEEPEDPEEPEEPRLRPPRGSITPRAKSALMKLKEVRKQKKKD